MNYYIFSYQINNRYCEIVARFHYIIWHLSIRFMDLIGTNISVKISDLITGPPLNTECSLQVCFGTNWSPMWPPFS